MTLPATGLIRVHHDEPDHEEMAVGTLDLLARILTAGSAGSVEAAGRHQPASWPRPERVTGYRGPSWTAAPSRTGQGPS
ncbi:acyl-CoA carboxylase subunit epsilon [Streptomyces sp. B1866]|uniref:acyl-CoA carboxylase subunit epsilon n=1 Tax=Streptomyces sp. B1866 TaxID=3075431 RepID=UPI0028922A26|nr:acyl-CoA carboxylase subunit epsilon [Streptomyces sp. B1866]MDT3395513.1 acyl-CoA carboxylase subunit epsilon [Streptomyces sp. B1866]